MAGLEILLPDIHHGVFDRYRIAFDASGLEGDGPFGSLLKDSSFNGVALPTGSYVCEECQKGKASWATKT